MTAQSQQPQERRSGTQKMLQRFLAERQDLWILYCRLAGLEPYAKRGPARERLEEFCQILMDYVAAGHFALYERILEGRERRKSVARLAAELYPRIAETTQFFVDFNDRYDQLNDEQLQQELSSDLSQLGERLATRIELEDRLIAELVPES